MPDFQLLSGNHDTDSDISRAAIYARTSSENQRFGYSLDEQVRRCLNRCQQVGWEVIYLFRDEAKSGKNPDRPMFQAMMQKAEQNEFDVVVFWKLDRFSRSLLHAVRLEAELRESGVSLCSVTEQIDTTTSAGRFNFRNIASAAEFERDMIQERTQMGLRALASEYKWPNDVPPLGYQKREDQTLEKIEEEVELVRLIFEKYLEMKSMPEVAQYLNDADYRTKKGNAWSPTAVGDILRNGIYIGRYTVAGVDEIVEEYRIISEKMFEAAVTVRHRFQSNSGASRNEMPRDRRKRSVDAIMKQYREYIECSV